MARDRNKPIKSWIERAKIETEELTIERAYELGKIRGKKDTIDKACEIYEKEIRQMKRILNEVKDGAGELISVGGSLIQFRKAMENE